MLAAAGFRNVALRTEGVNPFEILHTLKSKGAAATQPVAAGAGFDRVNTAFGLNEKMMQSPTWRMAKRTINTMLNLSAMGDSLKVAASL